MKQILVMMAAVVLVGCGKKDPELRSNEFITPNEAANKLYVDAVQLITSAEGKTGEAAIADYEEGLAKISKILSNHRESDLAVKLVSGETLFTGKSLNEIKYKVAELKRQAAELKLGIVKIADPIVEKAVREELKKPEGQLTKTDLEQVITLILSSTQITDESLKEVAKLKKLGKLFLVRTQITDAGLKEVAKLQNLAGLILVDTQITDAGLKEVAKLQNLLELILAYTQITDAGLKEITKLQNLSYLDLRYTKITDEGLKELAKLQKLQVLLLEFTKVTKTGVAELRKALPNCEINGL